VGWVVLMAIGVGAGFPLGLSVIAWHYPDAASAGAASGLAMGFGYLLAGSAPLVMGLLLDVTGVTRCRWRCCSWPARPRAARSR